MSDDFFTEDVPGDVAADQAVEDPFADAPVENSAADEDPFAEASSSTPALPAAPQQDEFKFTREWNMQFRQRCEEKDKAAMDKKQEILKAAREELLQWNEERAQKTSKRAEMNREEEGKLKESMEEDMKSANPWERVNKLMEMNAEGEHDLARMKQVMIRMKNDAAKM